ncbi:hypothetical protein CBR_g797 [Chara braunii]|uniref:Uncharacterized protein n=1 Tax=Chara braunii TaxID=69332 RepID=A0A388KCC8_CHABU|nr:hypothetical protein CBR_g797 [Chara braunii]|eukprot:GBG67667.1 hypothetical protein CBR_g797 [Chara braunii]
MFGACHRYVHFCLNWRRQKKTEKESGNGRRHGDATHLRHSGAHITEGGHRWLHPNAQRDGTVAFIRM